MATIKQVGDQLHWIIYCSEDKSKDIVDLILSTTRDERESIRRYYDETYPTNGLMTDIKNSSIQGDLIDLCQKLFMTRGESDAIFLQSSFGTFKNDDDLIFEILFNRPQWLHEKIQSSYSNLEEVNLVQKLESQFSDPFKPQVKTFWNTERRINKTPEHDKCMADAKKLNSVRPRNWFNENDIIRNIFAKDSPEELLLVFRYYYKLNGSSIYEVVDNLPRACKNPMKAFLSNILCPPENFAKAINGAIRGMGTDEKTLNRILTSRYDVDMTYIKKFYYYLFNTSIKEDIIGDTSGEYQRLLLGLLNFQGEEDY